MVDWMVVLLVCRCWLVSLFAARVCWLSVSAHRLTMTSPNDPQSNTETTLTPCHPLSTSLSSLSSYTVTLACNRQQAPMRATGEGGTARVLRRSTWRLDREPRCLLCRLGIRISTYDILSEIAVIAIRLISSMAVSNIEICEDKGLDIG